MDDDISAKFRPLEETRKKILTDVDLLNRVLDAWTDHLDRYFGYVDRVLNSNRRTVIQTTDMPRGFKELTELLTLWCDLSPVSIAPEPIVELGDYFHFALIHGPTHSLGSGDIDLYILHQDAIRVVDRMRLAAANLKPALSKGRGGRPPKPEVAARRKKVMALREKGLKLGKIAAELNESTDIVKQDIRRSKPPSRKSSK